jgi:antitoxin YefM
MIAVKPIDLRAKLKSYMDIAFNGETVIVSRKQNQNVVIVSEREYNELQKAKRNEDYLKKLDNSYLQLQQGLVITKTMKELERMANE